LVYAAGIDVADRLAKSLGVTTTGWLHEATAG